MNTSTTSSLIGLESEAWGQSLSQSELDSTRGGLFGLFAAFVGISMAFGMLDRILFGGCTCA